MRRVETLAKGAWLALVAFAIASPFLLARGTLFRGALRGGVRERRAAALGTMERGKRLLEAGKAAEAEDLFDGLSRSLPDNRSALNDLWQIRLEAESLSGVARVLSGDPSGADLAEEVAETAPRFQRLRANFALACEKAGRPEDAALAYARAAREDHRDLASLERSVEILGALGRPAEALALYDQVRSVPRYEIASVIAWRVESGRRRKRRVLAEVAIPADGEFHDVLVPIREAPFTNEPDVLEFGLELRGFAGHAEVRGVRLLPLRTAPGSTPAAVFAGRGSGWKLAEEGWRIPGDVRPKNALSLGGGASVRAVCDALRIEIRVVPSTPGLRQALSRCARDAKAPLPAPARTPPPSGGAP
jgi:hypothetical protein